MKENKKRKAQAGFTMVELMAVLIILGLLAAVVVKNFVGSVDRAKVTQTKANLKLLHSAVNQFQMDNSRWPGEDEGLSVLVQRPMDAMNWPPGGYLDTTDLPKDGWNRDFIYERFPESGKPFVIISLGADGQVGGENNDADLYSTDAF
jgi:general secretion pathway protein G